MQAAAALETSNYVREDGAGGTFRWMSSGSKAIIPSLIISFTLKEGEKGPSALARASVAILRTELVIGPEGGETILVHIYVYRVLEVLVLLKLDTS